MSLISAIASAYVGSSLRETASSVSPFDIVARNKRYDEYSDDDDLYDRQPRDYPSEEVCPMIFLQCIRTIIHDMLLLISNLVSILHILDCRGEKFRHIDQV